MKKERHVRLSKLSHMPMDLINPFGADPLGSYTGVTEDIFEKPVQDADDL